MMFGENHRISHIQMERQYQMVFFAPLLLFVSRVLQGWTGVLAVLIVMAIVSVVIFVLKRRRSNYQRAESVFRKLLIVIYQVFLVVAGVWVVVQASKLITEYMIQGVPRWFVMILFVLVSLALGKSPEVRGRFAEIAWPVIAGVIGIFFFFAFLQGGEDVFVGNLDIRENFGGFWSFSWGELWKNIILLLIFLSGTLLFPFLEIEPSKGDKENYYMFRMVGKLGIWLILTIVLQQLYFGENGAAALRHPLLDLMAGVQLPGGFVRRLDLIFLTVMLFALLFTMGSICFYSGYLWEKIRLPMGRIPVLLLIFVLVMSLSGCHIVEPEKRAYPLVMGIDWSDGKYSIYLAMAKIEQDTGQGKSGSEQDANMVVIEGENSKEIQEMYDASEELYLDVGHVQALVFSDNLLKEEEHAIRILADMEQNHDLGNSQYLFRTDSIQALFEKNGTQVESLGEYLVGLYENRMEKRAPRTLMEVYRWIHNQNTMPEIPRLKVSEEKIELTE